MQQFVYAPPMIGDPTCHRGRVSASQAGVRGAEVVERADQPHPAFQSPHGSPARPCATRQCCQSGAERPVEPFDVGGLDRPAPEQARRPLRRPMRQSSRHPDHPTIVALLDHLTDHQSRPFHEPTPPTVASARQRRTGHPPHLSAIGREAVHQDQQRRGHGTRFDQRAEPSDQCPSASGTDRPTKPKPGGDYQRQRHPDDLPLLTHPDLIRLHRTERAWLADDVPMDRFALAARRVEPRTDRLPLDSVGGDNRGNRAAVGDQGPRPA